MAEQVAIEEARLRVLRQYVGHHSYCPACYAVWREVADLVEDPYRAEPTGAGPAAKWAKTYEIWHRWWNEEIDPLTAIGLIGKLI